MAIYLSEILIIYMDIEKIESFSNTHVAYSIRKRFTGLINTIIGGLMSAVGSKKYLSKPVTFRCFKDETTKFLFLLSKT